MMSPLDKDSNSAMSERQRRKGSLYLEADVRPSEATVDSEDLPSKRVEYGTKLLDFTGTTPKAKKKERDTSPGKILTFESGLSQNSILSPAHRNRGDIEIKQEQDELDIKKSKLIHLSREGRNRTAISPYYN